MTVSFQKVSAIALDEVSKCKYIYFDKMLGVIDAVLDRSGVKKVNPISEDYFIAIKEAICDEFYGGMEPEFETKESFENWNKLNSEHYFFITENDRKHNNLYRFQISPYKDKTLPYLIFIK